MKHGHRRYAPALLVPGLMLHYLASLHQLEETLVSHVLGQHIFFLLGGYLVAAGLEPTLLLGYRVAAKGPLGLAAIGLWRRLARFHHRVNPHGLTSTVLFGGLVVAWHIPDVFNQFVADEALHPWMHLSFSIMGMLAYASGRMLYPKTKIVLLLAAGKLMILYGFLLTVTGEHLFTTYPLPQQPQLGLSLILSMLLIELGLAPYLIYRRYFSGA